MATEYYDYLPFGMKTMDISQIGSGYDGKNHYSHVSYEIDFIGEDTGQDVWRNKMKYTYLKIVNKYTKSSGNTIFLWPTDANGNPKKVISNGALRYVTIALTHSNLDYKVGQMFAPGAIVYKEGTAGYATGNHIHAEMCLGKVKYKVINSKKGYNLPDMVPMNVYMYVLDGYTTIKGTKGLSWKHIKSTEYKVTSGGTTSSTGTTKTYKEVTSPRFKIGNGSEHKFTTKVALNLRRANSKSATVTINGKKYSNVKLTIPKGKTVKYYGYYDLDSTYKAGAKNYFWLWVAYGNYVGFIYGKSVYLSGYEE